MVFVYRSWSFDCPCGRPLLHFSGLCQLRYRRHRTRPVRAPRRLGRCVPRQGDARAEPFDTFGKSTKRPLGRIGCSPSERPVPKESLKPHRFGVKPAKVIGKHRSQLIGGKSTPSGDSEDQRRWSLVALAPHGERITISIRRSFGKKNISWTG